MPRSAAAGELEGWQRWRADQLRQELVAKAEALFERPAPVKARPRGAESPAAAAPPESAARAPMLVRDPGRRGVPDAGRRRPQARPTAESLAPAEAAAPPRKARPTLPPTNRPPPACAARAGPARHAAPSQPPTPATRPPGSRKPRYGGRKMQETLRSLREQWKQIDQGGPPNHALWKRFDEACNEAYKVVRGLAGQGQGRSGRAPRPAPGADRGGQGLGRGEPHARKDGDWKGFNRVLHQFSDRWRDAGHLSEKAFAELQPQWKEAIQRRRRAAGAAAEAEPGTPPRHDRRGRGARRASPQLRIDAVKALQQRWQAEAQAVPLDRKQEQKLWDAFRKPIDEAFKRKTAEREKAGRRS